MIYLLNKNDVHNKLTPSAVDKICTNCVMDTTDRNIVFDKNGMCDYCHNYYDDILPNWQLEQYNIDQLMKIAAKIKKSGKGKKYDCIIGLSGGVDSSYLTYIAKEVMHLNPLIYVVDTGWSLNVATKNINKIVNGLKLDLYTEIVNWDEMRDLQLAFLNLRFLIKIFLKTMLSSRGCIIMR